MAESGTKDGGGTTSAEVPSSRTRSSSGSVPLATIAEIAGVSEATVSRVLNRRQGVSSATRQNVERALTSVGFVKPAADRVVLVLTDKLINPLFAGMSAAIETALSPHGLITVICPVYTGTMRDRDYVEAMIDAGIAAVVFMDVAEITAASDPVILHLLTDRSIPFLSVNSGFSAVDVPVVSTDDRQAAEFAVSHLWDLGHRRIGMSAGPSGIVPADRRVEGFLAAMESRGDDDPGELISRQHYSIEGGQSAAAELLALGVTAIVASSDEMALGAIRAIRRAGLTVPGDVSVIGYDDSPWLEFMDPPLTTVRQPLAKIAAQVARAVVSFVAGREVAATESFIAPELIVRGSTGPVREAGPAIPPAEFL